MLTLYPSFDRRGVPFSYTFHRKWHLFHVQYLRTVLCKSNDPHNLASVRRPDVLNTQTGGKPIHILGSKVTHKMHTARSCFFSVGFQFNLISLY